MRPLVPIGLGCASSVRNRQIVSGRSPGFSRLFGCFPSVRGGEHCPLAFGFHVGTAETEDFRRVLHGLSVLVSFVRRQQINDVSKFMQESEDLGVESISSIGPHADWARTAYSQRSAIPLNFNKR